ncbi:hypothetical protein [Candidatus Uabimicrobium sp. HlEnr_7]|uniref:hypothetical protein n=1 Tax=Candidatus Uabimicrobium helgolandensis TaxID=3095367 RepID=UPI0035570357
MKRISHLSTHSNCVKWLNDPSHDNYQECWQLFYNRYHEAILHYILRKAKWSLNQINEAEDIASKVYEKGFRWSFHNAKGVRFRILLKSLVRDVFRDYWRQKQLPVVELHSDLVSYNETVSCDLSWDILQQTISLSLEKYPLKQRNVLRWIWENGKWPLAIELADIIQVKSVGIDMRKAAAQQWKKRNRYIWEEFQKCICMQIEKLAYGEELQEQELIYFQHLK